MVETIKLYLNQDTLLTLEEHFEDQDDKTLHRFFYENLREFAKTSKLSDANRAINCNIFDENGAMSQKSYKYSEVDLELFKLASNPAWRPKDLDKESTGMFELKVGEKTHNHLSNYCKIHLARVDKFNKSIPRIEGKIDPRYKEIPIPTCIEEILHEGLYQPILTLMQAAAQELFDKENEEIEKAQAEKITKSKK